MNEGKIADPKQILALSTPVRQDILDTLLTGEWWPARALATQLGLRPSSLYYHLQALGRAGLLVARVRTREDGRSERVYRAARPRLEIEYRLEDAAIREAVKKAVGSLLRLARRDFERGWDHPDARVDGPARNLRGARIKAWLNRAEQERANRLLEELAELFLEARDPEGRTLCALSWVITPVHDRSHDRVG